MIHQTYKKHFLQRAFAEMLETIILATPNKAARSEPPAFKIQPDKSRTKQGHFSKDISNLRLLLWESPGQSRLF